jgi:type I restriction enzyme S subunit
MSNQRAVVSLGDIITDIQSGFASGERSPDGPVQLRMNNVTTDGNLDWSSFIRVPAAPTLIEKFQLHPGDIVFNSTNSPDLVGKTSIFTGFNEPVVFSNHFLRLRVDEALVSPHYLSYWFNLQWQKRVFESMCTQWVNQAAVRKEDLLALKLTLPSLPTQKQIINALDRTNHLRRMCRYARQLGESFLQSVFMEMFGKYLSSNTHTKLADIIDIPLANGLFEYNDNYGDGTPVIWVDNLYHTISVDTTNLRRAKIKEEVIKKYEVYEGDLLFTRSSLVKEGVGQVNIVPKLKERTTFECHTIRARVNKGIVNPHYILELYRGDFGRANIMQKAKTATMTTIGQSDINDLICPIPPLHQQDKFANTLIKFERLQAKQREAERQSGGLFQALLEMSFTME